MGLWKLHPLKLSGISIEYTLLHHTRPHTLISSDINLQIPLYRKPTMNFLLLLAILGLQMATQQA